MNKDIENLESKAGLQNRLGRASRFVLVVDELLRWDAPRASNYQIALKNARSRRLFRFRNKWRRTSVQFAPMWYQGVRRRSSRRSSGASHRAGGWKSAAGMREGRDNVSMFAASSAARAIAVPGTTGECKDRIVIVEGEKESCGVLRVYLEDKGYEVATAGTCTPSPRTSQAYHPTRCRRPRLQSARRKCRGPHSSSDGRSMRRSQSSFLPDTVRSIWRSKRSRWEPNTFCLSPPNCPHSTS